MNFETIIGIEVHAQLKTQSKLFCGCSTDFGKEPNTNVCPVCLAMPGALSVLNEKAVELAIRAGLALDCEIQKKSVFARKNYFYPDLPKGYQISQFDLPICLGGKLEIEVKGQKRKIGITRIHMEEDAGKLVHQGSQAIAGADYSLVDLNRASTPLIEIVSEPDIRSAREARAYVENLKMILEFIGVCDGNLEEGSLRADANVSIRPIGQKEFGTRTEIKNLNSFRSIEKAINYEIKRQTEILLSGEKVIQQTRNYDDTKNITTALRSKEEAHDYRYFPEPDLKPLILSDTLIKKVKNELPELPAEKQKRYEKLGIPKNEITAHLADIERCSHFDSWLDIRGNVDPVEISKWEIGDITGAVTASGTSFSETKATPEKCNLLLELITTGEISGKMAKEMIVKIVESGEDPKTILEQSGGTQISDVNALGDIIDKVLQTNLDVVEKVKAGKTKSADFLMGQVMRETKGRAKPDLVKELIFKKIAMI